MTTRAANSWQALSTNNIDMSSTESSGAPAEATATTPASSATPSFGSTRGSGLARGKRPTTSPASTTTAAATEYTPTAIEVVTAPREYQNPFAPVETPVAVTEPVAAVAPAPAAPTPVAPVKEESAPVAETVSAPASPEPVARVQNDEPAELNILEAEQKKIAPAQTWESEGFRPARESRGGDRPRREESRRDEPRREERAPREESAPLDVASIPEKFLYVRPGVTYVPTPTNYGGAPRERNFNRPTAEAPVASPASAPAKSGGFFGWLKSLFGGSPAAAPAPAEVRSGEYRNSGDRHRGGRGRGQGGGDGQRRRSRGGRGRSGGGYRGERSEGSSQGGI